MAPRSCSDPDPDHELTGVRLWQDLGIPATDLAFAPVPDGWEPTASGWSSSRHPPDRHARSQRGSLHEWRQPLRLVISSVACGSTFFRSPTTPKSTSSKIGASASLLTATIVLDVCIPARC